MMSFVFFVVLTMLMAFLMNWVFMTYVHTCGCSDTYKNESEKLLQASPTTFDEDIDDFLSN